MNVANKKFSKTFRNPGVLLLWGMLPLWVAAQSTIAPVPAPPLAEPTPQPRDLVDRAEAEVETRAFQQDSEFVRTYPEVLSCGQVLNKLEAVKGSRLLIPVEVAENVTRITFTLDGGTGDADLYVKYDAPPDMNAYDYRPFVNGNREEVLVDGPRAGRWYVMIHGYRSFRDVQFSFQCVQTLQEEERPEYVADQDVELALYYELTGADRADPNRNRSLRNRMLNQQGREAFTRGRFEEALELWSEWMRQDPENPRPVALVGDLYLRTENVEEAIRHYRLSLEMQPGQIALMGRLARILDQEADQPAEARALLNNFSRLFPDSSGVALAQAEWLIRRNRYEEALHIIDNVIRVDPENLNAMSLVHPLLRSQKERHENMRNMLRIGQLPGRELSLGWAIRENNLLTRPESWVLMDFIHRMAGEAPTLQQRNLFADLLPREDSTSENFRVGRMSTNWISSREETRGEDGNLVLSADPTQTEAFLRLVRSDAMHNGFVEAEVDDSRGFFWIYARRGQGNMIRFGFDESGQLFLQVWINEYLVSNETKPWSRLPGSATLRLEVRGDGAMASINGEPAFSSPVSIPSEMGLGWWGIAPWSAQYGTAKVTVNQISGGPLPKRLGLIPAERLHNRTRTAASRGSAVSTGLVEEISRLAGELSTLAPEWFQQTEEGELRRMEFGEVLELRLLARYYRMRLLPLARLRSYRDLNLDRVSEVALQNRVDGFTFLVERMPDPEWLQEAEEMVTASGITLHFVLMDTRTGKAAFRELCGTVGIFSGPRRITTLPLLDTGDPGAFSFSDQDPDMVLFMSKGVNRP